jgi:hypothetical protein
VKESLSVAITAPALGFLPLVATPELLGIESGTLARIVEQ